MTSLEFSKRRILMEKDQAVAIQVIGDFADQADFVLPLWYVAGTTLDATVATLSPEGVLTAVGNGNTIIKASRGDATAATVVGVGMPTESFALASRLFGIDAYPDSVTIVPTGGERQIVTSLGFTQQVYISKASDGTRYFSGNTDVVTVTPDGLIEAVGIGETTVTVIYGQAEEVLKVKVAAPTIGIASIGPQGGAVQNADGIIAAFGPGQLTGDATVSIETVTEAALPLTMPTSFVFNGAMQLNVTGGELQGPIQVAIPVAPGSAAPGDTVYFFEKRALPIGAPGELRDVWTVFDSGKVGDDGIARTSSPPFPGLSPRGTVLAARTSSPSGIVRMDLDYVRDLTIAFMPAIGIAAVGGLTGGVIALGLAGTYLSLLALPVLHELATIEIWRDYAKRDITIDVPVGTAELRIVPDLPETSAPTLLPTIKDITPLLVHGAGGTIDDILLTIRGTRFFDPVDPASVVLTETRVVFDMRGTEVAVEFGDADWVTQGSDGPGFDANSFITVRVPKSVLLGLAEIRVERPTGTYVPTTLGPGLSTTMVSSAPIPVDNIQGYAFFGNNSKRSIDVIDVRRPDEGTGAEHIVKRIELPISGQIRDTVTTGDLSRVFVATDNGVAVVDAMTLQLWDAKPSTSDVDLIRIPGDGVVTSLALDPQERYLYAAGTGKIYVIDLLPSSAHFHKVAQVISLAPADTPASGYISSIALNADGSRLFVAAPATRLFGGTTPFTRGGREHGFIHV
ncbi:MAG: hypothetical protein FJX57_17605, partial [Alphaproteobacteria bacterium]|nr:hypothetical protein [Alphaproteobacteria bacterium]